MRALILILLLVTPVLSFAQEQLAVRLNEQGIMKVLRMAVQYNTATKESRTIVIPQNIYKFTIKRSTLSSNPIVPILNEISNLNMNRDYDFYLNTSDIRLSGDVDAKSLKATIFNSTNAGFDIRLSLNLPQIRVDGARLSLCEDKQRNSKNCGRGLKAVLSGLRIRTLNRPVVLNTVLRLRTNGQVARVSVVSVTSNLESKSAPGLDINFSNLEIPKISIVIDGKETELDTSKLRGEILKRKSFLAQKLLAFAGDFIASDVAEMLNVYLINKQVATSWQVYSKSNNTTFNEFITSQQGFARNLFVRPAVIRNAKDQSKDPMTVMLGQISDVIRNAQLGLSLKKISTPANKDIELSGLMSFMLNGKTMHVSNRLGNSSRALPSLDLSPYRTSDINLAISEPLINGALDLANTTGLFQEMLGAVSDVKGFSVKSVKAHFTANNSIIVVVNSQVDLKKLESAGITSWFKNKIAAYLERNNNNAVIYFPIEVQVVPVFKKLASGGAGLDLRVLSPFNYVNLPNRFNYPSNVPQMTETVKDGVMEKLKESLESHVNKTYNVDMTKFLNQSGFIFRPNSISINQAAYLMLNLDLVDIKFNSKNPNLR